MVVEGTTPRLNTGNCSLRICGVSRTDASMTAPAKPRYFIAVAIRPPMPAKSPPSSLQPGAPVPRSRTITYTDPAGDESMASSMPCEADDPSLCSSLFSTTVTAGPANLVGDSGRISWDMYARWPYNCSIASETEATSTVLNPSTMETSAGCALSQAVPHAAPINPITMTSVNVRFILNTSFESPRAAS